MTPNPVPPHRFVPDRGVRAVAAPGGREEAGTPPTNIRHMIELGGDPARHGGTGILEPAALSRHDAGVDVDMPAVPAEVTGAVHRRSLAAPVATAPADPDPGLLVGVIARVRRGWLGTFDVLLYERELVLARTGAVGGELAGAALGLPILGIGSVVGGCVGRRLAARRDAPRLAAAGIDRPIELAAAHRRNRRIPYRDIAKVTASVAGRGALVTLTPACGPPLTFRQRVTASYPQDAVSVLRRALPAGVVRVRRLRRTALWRQPAAMALVLAAETGAVALLA